MTKSEQVRKVLEEYRDEIIDCGLQGGDCTCFKESTEKAQLRLDALYKAEYLGMLLEERELDYSKPDFISNNTDALYGFNSAIQEMKRRAG